MRRFLCFFQLCILACLAIFFASSLRAQDSLPRVHFLIGPMGGYNKVFYRSNPFPVLNSAPNSFPAQNGNGQGYFWGLSFEDPLSQNMRHFFILEVAYDSKPGTFSITPSPPLFVRSGPVFSPGPSSGDTIDTITGASLWTKLSYVDLDIGYKYNFQTDSLPNGFGIQICFAIDIKWDAIFWKSVTATYAYNGREIAATSIPDAQSLRLAIRPELTYDLPLNDRFIFTPFVGFDYPFTQVDQAENWIASTAYGGVVLRFAFKS